jgi:hypothetical protein
MKNLLTIGLSLALATIAAGQTYETTGRQKPVRPTGVRPPPTVTEQREVQGAIPRAVRGGNPLQMLNPLAPPKYGTAFQNVVLEPYTWKWKGIKLFEIVW